VILFCTAPKNWKLASALVLPSKAEFWRLCCTGLVRGLHNGNCAAAGSWHPESPWRETFWLLNHSRRKVKGPGAITLPAHCHFNKEQHLCYLAIPTHGSRWSFGVWGHTSCEALKCKRRSNRLGARFRQRWTGHRWKASLSCADALVPSDIIKTSSLHHSSICLSF